MAEKLEKNLDDYLAQMTGAYTASEGLQYSLLNHGDFHAKNLMYRNEGVTQDDFFLVSFFIIKTTGL